MTDDVARGRPVADAEDCTTVRWQPKGRAARRIVFEPREDGYLRREQVRDHADEWRDVGTETVETVAVELPGE